MSKPVQHCYITTLFLGHHSCRRAPTMLLERTLFSAILMATQKFHNSFCRSKDWKLQLWCCFYSGKWKSSSEWYSCHLMSFPMLLPLCMPFIFPHIKWLSKLVIHEPPPLTGTHPPMLSRRGLLGMLRHETLIPPHVVILVSTSLLKWSR